MNEYSLESSVKIISSRSWAVLITKNYSNYSNFFQEKPPNFFQENHRISVKRQENFAK